MKNKTKLALIKLTLAVALSTPVIAQSKGGNKGENKGKGSNYSMVERARGGAGECDGSGPGMGTGVCDPVRDGSGSGVGKVRLFRNLPKNGKKIHVKTEDWGSVLITGVQLRTVRRFVS